MKKAHLNNVTKIFGGPGCGKTTRLMEILEKELQTVAPDRIAYVSFSRKGAYEGRARAKQKFNLINKDLPYFRTLHSICFKELEMTIHNIMSKKDYKELSDWLGYSFTGHYTEEFYNTDDRYLFYYFLKKNNPKMAEALDIHIDEKDFNFISHNYDRYKRHNNVKDFTDLIEEMIKYEYVLDIDVAIIDEAQDLTSLQWDLCRILFSGCERVYLAGDDDQAIYEWNGADVQQFLDIKSEKEILQKSFRLPEVILEFSNALSSLMSVRETKVFKPSEEGGHIYLHNSLKTVPINKNESWLCLSRNNCHLQKYNQWLREKAFVYRNKKGPSFKAKEIKAIHIYERLRAIKRFESDEDRIALLEFMPVDFDLRNPWFDTLTIDEDDKIYYRDLIKEKTDLKQSAKIYVGTIHSVKGGEADNVIVLLDVTRNVHLTFDRNLDSELRCLYVACTRAKKNLHLVLGSGKYSYNDIVKYCLEVIGFEKESEN